MARLSGSVRFALALVGAVPAPALRAQAALPEGTRAAIDSVVRTVLASSGAPSASIAVVRDGALVYAQAYGSAALSPGVAARPEMRYSIGSISKQFTASAILLLAEGHQLSLDDKVSRWLPDLTRADEVTIRQLLSMTSGYQDYWPQDYVMPEMLVPTTPQAIVAEWARKPLDFEPGTRWQYSNTNYVIAGLIIERVSGMPLVEFLRQRVFAPLGMESVADVNQAPLPASDPSRYLRYALGPPRTAPKEAAGWLFAAGELAMTATDLARWDVSLIRRSLLAPESYRLLETDVQLRSGLGTGYGLGVSVGQTGGHRLISHGGEVSGFTARNAVYPDDSLAIVVFANLDATGAPAQIAGGIATLLFRATDEASAAALAQARGIFRGLQRGEIDRSLFSANANAYFSAQALADFASSLGPLGAPQEFLQTGQSLRGGMTFRAFRVRAAGRTLNVTTFTLPGGKLEQYQVARAE